LIPYKTDLLLVGRDAGKGRSKKHNNMKRKYILYAILPLMAFAVMGTAYVKADTTETGNKISDLVAAIAAKFNLNTNDVQQVFDEQKTKMDAQREEQRTQMETKAQEEFANHISRAVTDGKLTQEQADKILAKKAELAAQQEAQKTSMESIAQEERQVAIETMKTQMDSLKQWATDNNIPEEYIPFIGGRGHGMGGPGFGKAGR
jgi:hypothetical protein